MSHRTLTLLRSRLCWRAAVSALLLAVCASARELEPATDAKFQPDELAALSVPHLGLRTEGVGSTNTKPAAVSAPIAGPRESAKTNHDAHPHGAVAPPVSTTNTPTAQEAHSAPVARASDAALDAELKQQQVERLKGDLEAARYLRSTRQANAAIPLLEKLLADDKPDFIKQGALLELGYGAQDVNELPRAQTIFTQFLNRWPNDSRAPEILLRLGQNYRQMGLNNLALAKFYAVMTAALSLKSEQVGYYQKLVLQAQVEVAETNFQMGKFAEAAEFFARLLKQNDPALDRPQTQYRLIRSLAASEKHGETAAQAQDFLSRYNEAPQQPEVRFLLAQALKQTARNSEALQQVLVLLQEQKVRTRNQPDVWAYWQQRAGNEIGNQLYRDGDYPRALDVYQALADLDAAPSWKLPVTYQVGMTYERLLQPAKAIETYNFILARQTELGTNATPNLKALFEMAKWRASFLQWQIKADDANHVIANPPPLASASVTNATSASVASR